MNRYRFRLEQVLRVRRIEEEHARGDVLLARGDVARAEQVLEARREGYRSFRPRTGPVSAAEAVADRTSHRLKAEAVASSAERVAAAEEVLAERVVQWQGRAQRVQALERLDERRRHDHALEVQRDDDKVVDDLVVARFARTDDEEVA